MVQDIVNLHANMKHDAIRLGLTPSDPRLMTGQQWYDKFDEQLKRLVSHGDGETWMGWDCGEVREAAKRAAGLNTLKQEEMG